MTEIPAESRGDGSPTRIEFWLREAQLLKETADLSWQADINALRQVKLIYAAQHDRVLHHATEELGAELNLLYRYLISLAIQYLAIGILIARDPSYFLHQQPGHRIVALLQACEVPLTGQQRQLLHQTESAYEWGDRYPAGTMGDSHDELRQLTHNLSQLDCLDREAKGALDELYATLQRLALQQRAQEG